MAAVWVMNLSVHVCFIDCPDGHVLLYRCPDVVLPDVTSYCMSAAICLLSEAVVTGPSAVRIGRSSVIQTQRPLVVGKDY